MGLREEAIRLCEIVTSTSGPAGRTVACNNKDYGIFTSKDGHNIIESYVPSVSNKDERVVASILKQAAKKTADSAGDGTTTTIGLIKSILELSREEDWYKCVTDVMDSYYKVLSAVDKHRVELTEERLRALCTTSCNNNSEIGNLVADVAMKVGASGAIYLKEDVFSDGITVDYTPGYLTEGRLATLYYLKGYKEIRIDEVDVLVFDSVINDQRDMIHVFREFKTLNPDEKNMRPLIFVCRGVSGSALEMVAKNFIENNLPVVVVELKDEIEDIAAISSCKYLSPNLGHNIRDVRGNSGRLDGIVLSEKSINFLHSNKNLDEYIKTVKDPLRAGRLRSGTGTIKIGGPTAISRFEIAQLIEDSKYSALSALADGYVLIGGGYTMYKVGKEVGGVLGEALMNTSYIPAQTSGLISKEDIFKMFDSGYIFDLKGISKVKIKDCNVYDSISSFKESVKNGVYSAIEIIKIKYNII